MADNKTFYVTTPIYYVNAAPHVGTLYTTLAADILARYYRVKLGDDNVFFLTGTDEHGQKVAESAAKADKEPQEFADSIVEEYKKAWKLVNISYSHFFRTTDPRHKKIVHEVFQKIYDKGYIYKGLYEGLYCVGCEKFITETDIVDGKCQLHPDKELVEQKEENYFFKLSEFTQPILDKIKANEYSILPEKRKNEVISRIEQGVEDISISRESVSWGIPLPWDESHTFYVWVEALFNYYTATRFLEGKEKFWPAQVHLLAKDILAFHAFIWEALLLAADLELPEMIYAHGFFTLNGKKMSKSLGNVITPAELVEKYGTDGSRYLLMSAYQFGNDGDLSLEKFNTTFNADLANGLGNLVARSTKLAEGLPGVDVPQHFSQDIQEHIEALRFDAALEATWKRIGDADKYLNDHEPWKIKDNPDKKNEIMLHVLGDIVQIAFDLQPFLPDTATKIHDQCSGDTVTTSDPLFARI